MIQVHCLTGNPYSENTYILFDETTECVIIDPGCYERSEQECLLNFIKNHRLKPVLLLNTHCHIDHVLGNKLVFDQYGLLPRYHRDETPVIQVISSFAPLMGIQHYQQSPEAKEFLKEGETINFGCSTLRCLFTPGHSPGSISFYSETDQFIIGGDVLFYNSIGRTDLPGGDLNTLIKSIKTQFWSLNSNIKVYPGHGQPTTIGYEKEYNIFLN